MMNVDGLGGEEGEMVVRWGCGHGCGYFGTSSKECRWCYGGAVEGMVRGAAGIGSRCLRAKEGSGG